MQLLLILILICIIFKLIIKIEDKTRELRRIHIRLAAVLKENENLFFDQFKIRGINLKDKELN